MFMPKKNYNHGNVVGDLFGHCTFLPLYCLPSAADRYGMGCGRTLDFRAFLTTFPCNNAVFLFVILALVLTNVISVSEEPCLADIFILIKVNALTVTSL